MNPVRPWFYTYVLKCEKTGTFYTGTTDNLERRLKEHKKGGDFRLIYYEAYQSEKAARQREKKLKYYGSAWRALKQRVTA